MKKLLCLLLAVVLMMTATRSSFFLYGEDAPETQLSVYTVTRKEARSVIKASEEDRPEALEELLKSLREEEEDPEKEADARKTFSWEEDETRKYLLFVLEIEADSEEVRIPLLKLLPLRKLYAGDLQYKVLYRPDRWTYEADGLQGIRLRQEKDEEEGSPPPEGSPEKLFVLLRLTRGEEAAMKGDTPVTDLLKRQEMEEEQIEKLIEEEETVDVQEPLPKARARTRAVKAPEEAKAAPSDLSIDYTGGQKLTDAMIYDEDLISQLQVFRWKTIGSVYTTNNVIEYQGDFRTDLYIRGASNRAYPGLTLEFEQGYHTYDPEKTFIRYDFGDYDMVLRIQAVYTDRPEGMYLAFSRYRPSVESQLLYYDNAQGRAYEGNFRSTPYFRAVLLHVDIYEHGTDRRITLPNLYQFIGDVDSGQSYKNLNEPFVASGTGRNIWMGNPAELMDLDDYAYGQMNYFDAAAHTVYSSYATGPTGLVQTMNNPNLSNLWQRVRKLSSEGTDMVFGFMGMATSYVEFGSTINTVYYAAEEGGRVTNPLETVWTEDSPSQGSEPRPYEGYYFSHWTTNQEVYLRDGTVISAEEEITMEQIFQVIVYEDYTFTAHFEPYASVILRKRIRADEVTFDHGVPVFLLRMDGVDDRGEPVSRTAMFSFTEDEVLEGTDEEGYVTLEQTLEKLRPGTYTAREIRVIRYRLRDIVEIQNGVKAEDTVEFSLSPGDEGAATFLNDKKDWGGLSDTAEAVNHVEGIYPKPV